MRVKCLAQEHNTLSPARARTRTAHSGVERTNHEATAPPPMFIRMFANCSLQIYSKLAMQYSRRSAFAKRVKQIVCVGGGGIMFVFEIMLIEDHAFIETFVVLK